MGRSRYGIRVNKTTGNVLKAKRRKERNRKLRRQKEEAEARRLGISIRELRHRKFKEVQKFRTGLGKVYVSKRTLYSNPEDSDYWSYD